VARTEIGGNVEMGERRVVIQFDCSVANSSVSFGVRAFSKEELFNGIMRILEDAGRLEITRFDLEGYGHSDWPAIKEALSLWEKKGYLQVLKNPEDACKEDVCVRMFSIRRNKRWPDCY
jgi:hypothetical protein